MKIHLIFIILICWIIFGIYDLVMKDYEKLIIDLVTISFLSISLIIILLYNKTREKKVAERCGCICYCPKCKEILNDFSDCKKLTEEGLYEYTCSSCGEVSKFHFGIAPVPIYVENYKDLTKPRTEKDNFYGDN